MGALGNRFNQLWEEGIYPIKAKVDKFKFPTIVNNLLATVAGNALDAVQGRILHEKDVELEGKINEINGSLDNIGKQFSTKFSNKNAGVGTTVTLATLSVPAGTYIVNAAVRSDVSAAQGRYFLHINSVYAYPSSTDGSNTSSAEALEIVTLSSNGTLKLSIYNESCNATSGFQGRLQAVRIR